MADGLTAGLWLYSPILHCHPIALAHQLPLDAHSWWEFNRTMLDAANRLFLLKAVGWQSSRGVRQELAYADAEGIPVYTVEHGSPGWSISPVLKMDEFWAKCYDNN